MRLITVKPNDEKGATSHESRSVPDKESLGRQVYDLLLCSPQSEAAQQLSRVLLECSLADSGRVSNDLPASMGELESWACDTANQVAADYRNYLTRRKRGEAREFFSTRGHALYFLTKVAPTKLVDGAWLYGVTKHWSDLRYRALITTYLEELGEGDPSQNHVLLYRKLMASLNLDHSYTLDDKYYFQGALQLALGFHSEEFLPELLGYNLGYEQLPLHLLISTYELAELGIDAYYFTLHVAIDNASTGHSRQAIQAVLENAPATEEAARTFYDRVMRGYSLNNLGIGSTEVIQSFDLYQEVVTILQRKSQFAQIHSDYRKIKGRTVNQWLSDPNHIPEFLHALMADGWIRMDQNPDQSPFWRLLQGPKGCMFGVFNHYERTIIYEWIAGSWLAIDDGYSTFAGSVEHTVRSKRSSLTAMNISRLGNAADSSTPEVEIRPQRALSLIELMAPGRHHTPEGLRATRNFSELLHK